MRRFHEALARRDFRPEETSLVEPLPANVPEDFAVAGTESCRECHAADARLWDASRHAHAWQSLEEKNAAADPDCQRCHVTGYGLPGGFVSARRSPSRVQVGCESCHGPARGHVRQAEIHTPYFAEAKNHCTSCHDRENSPKFALEEYWARIRHGASSKAAAPAETKTKEDRR